MGIVMVEKSGVEGIITFEATTRNKLIQQLIYLMVFDAPPIMVVQVRHHLVRSSNFRDTISMRVFI